MLFLKRLVAKKVLDLHTQNQNHEVVESIHVYHTNPEFPDFVRWSLNVLKSSDSVGFRRVQTWIRAIVEFGRNDYCAGRVLGMFFDSYSNEERMRIGTRRYATYMVRLSTEIRLLEQFGMKNILRPKRRNYDRILSIAVRRELRSCILIGGDDKHLLRVRQWLEDHQEKG